MTSPSEKHIYAAKAALTGSVIAFGTTHGYDDLVKSIAAALANAEREGMKRAAEIVEAYEDEQDKVVRASAVRRAILSEAERA